MALYVFEVKHGCTHTERMQIPLLTGYCDDDDGFMVTSRADLHELRENARRPHCVACTGNGERDGADPPKVT